MKTFSLSRGGLLLVLFLAWQCTAWAHAFLDHAEPAVGSNIQTTPGVVKIWFTQQVEPAFSAIEVQDSQGHQIDKKDTHTDAANKSQLLVSVPALPAGTYTVIWHVVSVDTHKTNGRFKFTVKP